MKIFSFSDTHGEHHQVVPTECDIAIFAGDATTSHDTAKNIQELDSFVQWFRYFPATYKVMIAGNHDVCIERIPGMRQAIKAAGIIYLENEVTEVMGLSIYGAPYSRPWGKRDWAFTRNNAKLGTIWSRVPEVDIMVTHSMPYGVLDTTDDLKTGNFISVGCRPLAKALTRIRPWMYFGGHIHSAVVDKIPIYNYGMFDTPLTTFYNCTAVTDRQFGGPINPGHLIEV